MLQKNRDTYYDVLRGLAILQVIGIHTYGGGNLALREILNMAVPLFLAISGYFIGKKSLKTPTEYNSFLSKQLPRVYIPCLLWSFPIIALEIYVGRPPLESIIKLFCCSAFIPYYYIALIIQFYLLSPLIKKASYGFWYGILILIINIVSVYILNYYIIGKISLPFVLLVGPFIYWIVFFYIGMVASHRQIELNPKLCILIVVLLFLVQLWEADSIGEGIKVSSWMWALSVITLLLSSTSKRFYHKYNQKLNWLGYIGRYSFGIYLVHVYILYVFYKLQLMTSIWLIDWLVITLVTLAVVVILDKISPRRFVKYLGLN